jgi:hypothetical protein
MRLEVITKIEAAITTMVILGLDPASSAVRDTETLAAAVRRMASFRCPTTPRALADEVIKVLEPISVDELSRPEVIQAIEQLVSIGDLIELPDVSGTSSAQLLYLGPPSFIARRPGQYLVTGIRPLGTPLLPEDLMVVHAGHTRTVHLPADDTRVLREAGLQYVRPEQWVEVPEAVSAHEWVSRVSARFAIPRPAGFIDGLRIIDPSRPNDYYVGRWRSPVETDKGDFVGRRPQAYGADQWCFVRVEEGHPRTLIDLPNDLNSSLPGRDEAWKLQYAIDASRGSPVPVRFRQHPTEAETHIVDFFSPLPTWAQRYVDLRTTPCDRSVGALFSLRVAEANVKALEQLLTKHLWLSPIHDGGTP